MIITGSEEADLFRKQQYQNQDQIYIQIIFTLQGTFLGLMVQKQILKKMA